MTGPPPERPTQDDSQTPPAKHRPGEGVTVIPDTGKRGSRPKSDPSPYPPRPTPPLSPGKDDPP